MVNICFVKFAKIIKKYVFCLEIKKKDVGGKQYFYRKKVVITLFLLKTVELLLFILVN